MFIDKNHRVKIEDAEKGCFLRVTLKGKQTEIGRPKASRAVCIYRCNACFTDAIALDSFDCIPSKTLVVLSEYEGVYSLLYMLEDQGCSCSLSGREGKIFLDAEGEEDRPDKSYPVRAAYSVSGQNVYELILAAADILSRSFPRLKKKSEKRTSDFLGKLGFCTYNAFYENVTEQKILAVLDAAKSKGVQFGFLIVDSGWMQEKEEKLSAFDPDGRKSDKVVGYVAYMSLLNGFEKFFYMSREECEKHAKRYSKTYQKGYGKWKEDFDSMAKKTVLKLLISKYGIMSVDMQKAVEFDQSTVQGDINHIEEATAEYIDNEQQAISSAELTEEQMLHNYEKVKNDPKAAEIALARGEISLDLFNRVIDNNM